MVAPKYILYILFSFVCELQYGLPYSDSEENKYGVYNHCVTNGEIALTFDDGPSQNTEKVLDVLGKYGVKATFFVNGHNYENIDHPITQARFRRIIREGHQIGSHTWSHSNLTDNKSAEFIRREMLQLEEKVQEILGFKMNVMRPPFGDLNYTVWNILHNELGYSIIMWNLDTMDWTNTINVDFVMEAYYEVMEGAFSGNSSFIALHHDTLPEAATLASRAIKYIQQKGFSPVLISKCIGDIN